MVGATVTEEFKGLARMSKEIDTKAMRKLKENDVLFGMFETATEIGAATITFVAQTRVLIKF